MAPPLNVVSNSNHSTISSTDGIPQPDSDTVTPIEDDNASNGNRPITADDVDPVKPRNLQKAWLKDWPLLKTDEKGNMLCTNCKRFVRILKNQL